MLETKYNHKITSEDFELYIIRKKNQIFKLLPLREEGADWAHPLNTILIELTGLNDLEFNINKVNMVTVLSKLEALYRIEDMMLYRKTIFEILTILEEMR